MDAVFADLIGCISNGTITTRRQLEREKIVLAKRHGMTQLVKNAQLIEYAQKTENRDAVRFLLTKPVRTLSGVANIAVMWKGATMGASFYSCPYHCIYCPQGEDAPKAYTGIEPTTMRARRHGYDPHAQITDRLRQFQLLGHATDKCELIVMGGTFMTMPRPFREHFVQRCFDAFNDQASKSLADAHTANETAANRCIGVTIETRADWCAHEQIDDMLSLGGTRVEIGVQTTDDALLVQTKRGHDSQANKDAFARLRSHGLKITAHWMPGLTGLRGEPDLGKELAAFTMLFDDPAYRPDELKIYPTLVVKGTELYDLWQNGQYYPLEQEQMLELLVGMKAVVPDYVRIKRIMRDISEHVPVAGTRTTNLRQLAREQGVACRCIRCREIGVGGADTLDLKVQSYDASDGTEFFLSFVDDHDRLAAFLRLRLDDGPAKIREVHVYGRMEKLGARSGAVQHKGMGKHLIAEAEKLAREHGKETMLVTSGVGVRPYYRALGYALEGAHMMKRL